MKSNNKETNNAEITLADMANLKSGEAMHRNDVATMMANDKELEVGRVRYSSKQMEQATERFDNATQLIFDANDRLMNQAKKTQEESKKACKQVKIAVSEIRDQLNKVDSILGDNVENKICQLERIAASLKIIKELSGDTKTLDIVSALVKK